MLQMLRVDHRLIHGQVVMSWLRTLEPTAILIADDDLPGDSLRKDTLALAKPADVKLVVKTVDDAIKSIRSGKTDPYRLLVLTADVASAVRLAEACDQVTHINLGGTAPRDGVIRVSNAVGVTAEELADLQRLQARGVEIEARKVATDRKTPLPAGAAS